MKTSNINWSQLTSRVWQRGEHRRLTLAGPGPIGCPDCSLRVHVSLGDALGSNVLGQATADGELKCVIWAASQLISY